MMLGDSQSLRRRTEGTATRAEVARRGLHDLTPYWSDDTESMVDPLDDPTVRAEVRRTFAELARHGCLPSRTATP